MRVLVAGATGAIGRPLVVALREAGHEVLGLTRDRAKTVPGAQMVVADALDRAGLLRAVDGISADVVIHQLTALKETPAKFQDMEATNTLRTTGTAHLLEVARAVGATRFVTQSAALGYGYVDHGARLLTENDQFGTPRGGKADPVVTALAACERQVFEAPGVEGIALRYGTFYGLAMSETFVEALQAKNLPVPRGGGAVTSWIHIADAVAATVAAIEKGSNGQAYNIVDDTPAAWGDVFGEHARVAGTKPPKQMPNAMLKMFAPYYSALLIDTSMRVSNAKAKAELGWSPRFPDYRLGISA